MSKTGDKIFKYALDKGRSVKNSLWIAGCFLLVAANIAFSCSFRESSRDSRSSFPTPSP